MTEPSAPPRPAVNGELSSRVEQLRLSNQLGMGKTKSGGGGASWFPWLLCGIMALVWAGVGVRAYKAGGFGPSGGAAPAGTFDRASNGDNPAPAKTSSTNTGSTGSVAGSGDILLELKGTLIPPQQIAITPIDVGGRVVELNVVEGKAFKKGDVIARLEDVSYQAQAAEAQASLMAAKARLTVSKLKLAEMMPDSVRKIEVTQVEEEFREAEAMRSRTQDDVTRFEKLGSSAADRELKQARFDLLANEAKLRRLTAVLQILKEGPRQERKDGAEADIAVAEAEVMAAEARLAQAKWRTENCIIRAPIDGIALTKKAEVGNLVNPMAFSASTSGGSICDLANLADMEVELDVPEREIQKVRVNQAARIRSEAYPDKTYQGRLDRIMPIADDSKNVIKIRVKVILPPGEVPGSYLKPKMSVVVTLVNSDFVPATTTAATEGDKK